MLNPWKNNNLSSIIDYLKSGLSELYDEREIDQIITHLCNHYLGLNRADIILSKDKRLSESEILQFHFALKKLRNHEPIQYITGKTWFYRLELEVNKAVLIPRPETEELFDLVIRENKLPSPRILDIGTGSGCIALALKKNIPGAQVTAIDISEQALETANRNAKTNGIEVEFIQMDILREIPSGQFDIVVSNPPYIPRTEINSMENRVTSFEPHTALFVDDAMTFYKRFEEILPAILPKGIAAFELHENFSEKVKLLFGKFDSEIIRDMQGKERMILIKFDP